MVPDSWSDTATLKLIRARAGHAIHVKSEVGMWPGCRRGPTYGSRVIEYRFTRGRVTCRWCRQTYDLLVPGERRSPRS